MQELQPPASGLLTASEVGRWLGVDATTVYRMAAAGRLPALKVGRQWRFPAARLHDSLTAGPAAGSRPTAEAPQSAGSPRLESTAAVAAADPWHDRALIAEVVGLTAEALGVMMVVTDMAGRPITPIANPCAALATRSDDPELIAACSAEWRQLATDPDFEPRFSEGALGFECARALVRSGDQLIGMVLAGGVAPHGSRARGLHRLGAAQRRRVLQLLPRFAASLSRLAGHAGHELARGGTA